jgi:hypothetical protein
LKYSASYSGAKASPAHLQAVGDLGPYKRGLLVRVQTDDDVEDTFTLIAALATRLHKTWTPTPMTAEDPVSPPWRTPLSGDLAASFNCVALKSKENVEKTVALHLTTANSATRVAFHRTLEAAYKTADDDMSNTPVPELETEVFGFNYGEGEYVLPKSDATDAALAGLKELGVKIVMCDGFAGD